MKQQHRSSSPFSVVCICSKGALVILATLFTGFCSYAYISWFILPYLIIGLPNMNQLPGEGLHRYALFLIILHSFLVTMLMWSLIKTWWSNPGNVTDYFKSVVVKETVEKETITQERGGAVERFVNTGFMNQVASAESLAIKSERITRVVNLYKRSIYELLTKGLDHESGEAGVNQKLLQVQPLV